MKFLRALSVLPCIAFALASATSHAQITKATVYLNIPDPNDASDLAQNTKSTLASADFTVGALGINFNTNDSPSTTIGTFLNNPIFSNQVNGFSPSTQTNNSEIVITGFATLFAGPNSFVVGHDDGVVLNFPAFGNVVFAPGPTSLSLSPFTVTAPSTGSYAFTLEYSENSGGPADLDFTVNTTPITSSASPEPSSFIMLGSGLLGAVGMVRRRFAV